MNELVEKLVAAVNALAQPRVALELRWVFLEADIDGDGIFDRDGDWVLELHAIVEQPGWYHSQYSTPWLHRFPAEELTERREAHRIAEVVAERTHLALHAPPVEDSSDWLSKAPSGPAVPYECSWEASWWTDEGRAEEARGRELVHAESGESACMQLGKQLESRFPRRQHSLRIEVGGMGRSWDTSAALYPAELPGVTAIRALALAESYRASRIARALPATSGLSLMLAFRAAFNGWSLGDFAPLAAWRRGELDDAALDDAVSPLIEGSRTEWDLPRMLREVKARGDSIAAFVRNVESKGRHTGFHLRSALREAFDFASPDLVLFVDRCRNPTRDAANDRFLERLIREHSANRRRHA